MTKQEVDAIRERCNADDGRLKQTRICPLCGNIYTFYV